jgi:hypothetical protein
MHTIFHICVISTTLYEVSVGVHSSCSASRDRLPPRQLRKMPRRSRKSRRRPRGRIAPAPRASNASPLPHRTHRADGRSTCSSPLPHRTHRRSRNARMEGPPNRAQVQLGPHRSRRRRGRISPAPRATNARGWKVHPLLLFPNRASAAPSPNRAQVHLGPHRSRRRRGRISPAPRATNARGWKVHPLLLSPNRASVAPSNPAGLQLYLCSGCARGWKVPDLLSPLPRPPRQFPYLFSPSSRIVHCHSWTAADSILSVHGQQTCAYLKTPNRSIRHMPVKPRVAKDTVLKVSVCC